MSARSWSTVASCRAQTQDEVEPLLRAVLGDGDYELEWIEARGGTRSPLGDAALGRGRELRRRDRAGGGGRFRSPWRVSRTATGCVRPSGPIAYGFCPMRAMDPQLAARLIHSADERIAVDDLELAVQCFRHVAVEVTGAS